MSHLTAFTLICSAISGQIPSPFPVNHIREADTVFISLMESVFTLKKEKDAWHLARIIATRSPITAIASLGDRKRLATTGEDGNIQIWDANNGMLLSSLKGHKKR